MEITQILKHLIYSYHISIPIILGLFFFTTGYILIASEKIDKTIVALLTASFMVAFHLISSKQAFEYVDLNVLFTLIGMMIIAEVVGKTGLFEFVGAWIAKNTKGNPIAVMVLLFLFTGFISMFLNNVTTAILIVPVTLVIAQQLEIDPRPILILEAIAGNIGGTATLIGDPPNLLIGTATKFSFMDFIVNLGPPVLLVMVLISIGSAVIFRKKYKVSLKAKARIKNIDPKAAIKDKKFFYNALIILSLTIFLFIISGNIHEDISIISLLGAGFILLIDKEPVEETIKNIEWSTILFFSGLFIMVGTLEELGVLKFLAEKIMNFSHNNLLLLSMTILWASAFISAIVDNIPLVAALIPMIKFIEASGAYGHNVDVLWWSLSIGACFGGMGTVVGASSNVLTVQIAKKNRFEITFGQYTLYGMISLVASLIAVSIYIYLVYF